MDTRRNVFATISLSRSRASNALALIRRLRDQVSFSASSACATDKVQTSHVLIAMFGDTTRARGAFRISPGRFTAESDGARIAKLLVEAAGELRRMAA